MAIIKTANTTGKYHDLCSYNDIITYITQPNKTIHRYIGYINIDPYNPSGSMEAIAKKFHKEHGVHVRHFIIAFNPDELTQPEVANEIGAKVISYLGQRFQAVYAVHEDEPQLHIHIVINAVCYLDGSKYRGTHKIFNRFVYAVRRILKEYRITNFTYVSNKP